MRVSFKAVTRPLLLIVAVAIASCARAEAPPVAPGAERIAVRKADPPRGARELGPIEAQSGSGCGGFGARGSYQGALAELRNTAAKMGANYVELMGISEPHNEGHCAVNAFKITGVAFVVGAEDANAPAPAAADCDPPCSPGYACASGTCHALCNPPCSGNQVCRQDRTCGPAAP